MPVEGERRDPGLDGREVVDFKAQTIDNGKDSWGMSDAARSVEPVGQATATLQLYRAFLYSDETRNPSPIKVELNRIGIGYQTRLNRGT